MKKHRVVEKFKPGLMEKYYEGYHAQGQWLKRAMGMMSVALYGNISKAG